MKLSLLSLPIALCLGLFAFACDDGGEASTLGGDRQSENSENAPLPNTTKSETTTPPSTSPSGTTKPTTPPAAPKPAPTTNTNDCSKSANQTDCFKCCGANNNPFKTCACTAGSKCEKACAANFCSDKAPDFACGICLAQADCDTGENPTNAAQACVEQNACSSKPK